MSIIAIFILIQWIIFLSICFLFLRILGLGIFFSPFILYFLFHFLVFVVRPTQVYLFNFDLAWSYIGFWPSDAEFVFTLAVATIGLLSFSLGAALFMSRDVYLPIGRDTITEHRNTLRSFQPAAADWFAFLLVLLFLGPVIIYSLLNASSLHENMSQEGAAGVRIFVEGNGYLGMAYQGAGALLLIFVFLSKFRWWAFLPLIAYIAFRIDLGWGRFGFMLPLLSVALFLIYSVGFKKRYIFLVLGGLSLFQFTGRSRGNFDAPWWRVQDNIDFANFEFLAFILNVVPSRSGTFSYFTQYLQIFTEPIPRALWASKPVGPPIELVQLSEFGNFTAATTSLVGDGWISLGILGVILMLFLTGAASTWIYRFFLSKRTNVVFILLYFTLLPITLFWFRDGGIFVLKILLFVAGPVLVWFALRYAIIFSIAPRRRWTTSHQKQLM